MRILSPKFLCVSLAMQMGCAVAGDNEAVAIDRADTNDQQRATSASQRANSLVGPRETLVNLVDEADFSFRGTLEEVQYKDSVEGLPHTFATYKVESVISGSYDSDRITLRFIGGRKEGSRTRRLVVSNSPTLELGEESILLVRRNGEAICPLSNCEQGRFVVHGNNVFDAHNSVFAAGKDGTPMRVSQAERDEGLVRYVATSVTDFEAHLRQVANRPGTNRSARVANVQSANVSAPFSGPHPAASAGPAPVNKASGAKPANVQGASDFDRWEEQQLRDQNGDPILRAGFKGTVD